MSHTDEKLDAVLRAVGCLIQEQRATRASIQRLIAERENDLANAREDHEQQGRTLLEHESRLNDLDGRVEALESVPTPLGGTGHG